MPLWAGLGLTVIALSVLSLITGAESISLTQAIGHFFSDQSVDAIILREVRLPRTLIAIVAGATLGLCGAAMQGLLRNPLASPGLVGSASGAALGAVTILYFGLSTAIHPQLVPLAGMLGALLATSLVYLMAGRDANVTTLILSGVAINALATAGMSLLLNFAPSPFALRELVLWTLGDLSDRSLPDFFMMLPCTIVGWLMLSGIGRQLDALTLGERTAESLGVRPQALRWRVFIAVSLAVGASVATTGMIGFIGLVVPHLMRPLVGFEPRRLLAVSALGGSAMLLAADLGVRLLPTPTTLKVGVLTSLVGAPFFLHLILKSRRDGYR